VKGSVFIIVNMSLSKMPVKIILIYLMQCAISLTDLEHFYVKIVDILTSSHPNPKNSFNDPT
jgi:hypothetical protein